jgi:hypothetical protein
MIMELLIEIMILEVEQVFLELELLKMIQRMQMKILMKKKTMFLELELTI